MNTNFTLEFPVIDRKELDTRIRRDGSAGLHCVLDHIADGSLVIGWDGDRDEPASPQLGFLCGMKVCDGEYHKYVYIPTNGFDIYFDHVTLVDADILPPVLFTDEDIPNGYAVGHIIGAAVYEGEFKLRISAGTYTYHVLPKCVRFTHNIALGITIDRDAEKEETNV